MFFQAKRTTQSGFTLLELLVVIALLAIVAGTVMMAYDGVQDQGRADATKFEMAELRKALLQFRRDSGSRDFPDQGVYDCDSLSLTIAQANDPAGVDTWPNGAPSADSDAVAWSNWCKHPANFWMLFTNPLDDLTTVAVEEGKWNPDTHRGWNGPYLQRKSGYLTLNSNRVGLSDINDAVWAIADPFITDHKKTPLSGLNWSIETTSAILQNAGSPYLLLDPDLSTARIVSLDDNGDYDGDGADLCSPPLDPSTSAALDTVLCLLR